jgi:hypothetical protein
MIVGFAGMTTGLTGIRYVEKPGAWRWMEHLVRLTHMARVERGKDPSTWSETGPKDNSVRLAHLMGRGDGENLKDPTARRRRRAALTSPPTIVISNNDSL